MSANSAPSTLLFKTQHEAALAPLEFYWNNRAAKGQKRVLNKQKKEEMKDASKSMKKFKEKM